MTPKNFKRLLARDNYCLHCGETEALSPNHRINRGMGGSKLRDQPSNFVLICSLMNHLIEADDRWSQLAKRRGWKLESWQDPLTEPVFDSLSAKWFMLDDDFGRSEVREG